MCNPHAGRCQRPAFVAGSETRPCVRYCRYSKLVGLLLSVSSIAISARVHLSHPVLVLVAMRQQKRAAPVGSPSLDRSLLALYQGVALSARESVLPCANARAATAGVPVRMTGAWLQAVWMEALFIVRHLPRGGDGCESSGSTCRVQGSRVTFL